MAKQYWLIKTEPESFSIQDLVKSPKKTTFWNGVRNYQARNFLRDSIHVGDVALFYHSSANPPAIVGTATIVRAGYPDFTARDPQSQYFDPKASDENPIWYMVDVRLERIFERALGLDELRRVPALKQMELLRQGSRLSVQPVRLAEFETVLKLAETKAPVGPASAKPKPRAKKVVAKVKKKSATSRKTTRSKNRKSG